jgi:hypothetical protein
VTREDIPRGLTVRDGHEKQHVAERVREVPERPGVRERGRLDRVDCREISGLCRSNQAGRARGGSPI